MSEKGTLLEIGPGENPLPPLRPDIAGSPGRRIFLERSEKDIPGLRQRLIEMGVEQPEIVVGDISKFSLEEKVDTVLIANVFGAQGIGTLNKTNQTLDKLDIGDEAIIIGKIASLCKSGSNVIVIETYEGPVISEIKIRKLFEEKGFTVKERYIKGKLDRVFDQSTENNKSRAKAINEAAGSDSFVFVLEKN